MAPQYRSQSPSKPLIDRSCLGRNALLMTINIDRDFQNILELGKPIIICGPSESDNWDLFKRTLEYRENRFSLAAIVHKEREALGLGSLGMMLFLATGECSQENMIKASLRHDPNGLVVSLLEPHAMGTFLKAFATGCSINTTVLQKETTIPLIIQRWLKETPETRLIDYALKLMIFVELNQSQVRFYKASIIGGKVQVSDYNHINEEKPVD